jgi:hypothetical protein
MPEFCDGEVISDSGFMKLDILVGVPLMDWFS